MERLSLKHRPTFRENYLRPALAQGVIESTIPDKPTSRLQKYRLAENEKVAQRLEKHRLMLRALKSPYEQSP